MKIINKAELKAMISLLDDPSNEIYVQVRDELKKAGIGILSILQTAYYQSDNAIQQQRLKSVINHLRQKKLKKELQLWKNSNADDLLEGVFIIARYAYPDLDETVVKHTVHNMEKKIAEQIANKSGVDVVEVMNEVILHKYGFSGNTENYSGAQNSYINKVIESKMGNPIMLCILYLLIAKRLNIPLIGINSPRHFILAYLGEKANMVPGKEIDNVSFFVDPFYQGTTYSTAEYIKSLKSEEFYNIYKHALPASNVDIIKRVLNNVIYAIHEQGMKNRAKNLLRITETL